MINFYKILKCDFESCRFRVLPKNFLIGAPIAFILNPGYRSVVIYRLQSSLKTIPLIGFAFEYSFFLLNHLVNGCEFMPGCRIGPGLVVRHPTGIVIGSGVTIGSNCTLQHGVTIGLRDVQQGVEPSNLFPKIGNFVTIGTHAVVVGNLTISDSTKLKANQLYTKSI